MTANEVQDGTNLLSVEQENELTPEAIMKLGMAYWGSKGAR